MMLQLPDDVQLLTWPWFSDFQTKLGSLASIPVAYSRLVERIRPVVLWVVRAHWVGVAYLNCRFLTQTACVCCLEILVSPVSPFESVGACLALWDSSCRFWIWSGWTFLSLVTACPIQNFLFPTKKAFCERLFCLQNAEEKLLQVHGRVGGTSNCIGVSDATTFMSIHKWIQEMHWDRKHNNAQSPTSLVVLDTPARRSTPNSTMPLVRVREWVSSLLTGFVRATSVTLGLSLMPSQVQ